MATAADRRVGLAELTEEIVAFGQEAADMTGREGRDVSVRAPLIGGVVADFERTKKMLAHFVKKAKTGGSNISLQAVMSMVSDVTHVEQRALAPGAFYALLPPRDDIHRVRTTSAEASVSIHLLTNDIGCVWRHTFEAESGAAKPCRS